MIASTIRRAAAALALSLLPVCAASSLAAAQTPREEFPAPSGFAPAFETVGGVRLHYLKGGQGPLVLLIHGFGQTWYEWRQLMPLLAADHTVVAVDLPGLGLSSQTSSYTGRQECKLLL